MPASRCARPGNCQQAQPGRPGHRPGHLRHRHARRQRSRTVPGPQIPAPWTFAAHPAAQRLLHHQPRTEPSALTSAPTATSSNRCNGSSSSLTSARCCASVRPSMPLNSWPSNGRPHSTPSATASCCWMTTTAPSAATGPCCRCSSAARPTSSAAPGLKSWGTCNCPRLRTEQRRPKRGEHPPRPTFGCSTCLVPAAGPVSRSSTAPSATRLSAVSKSSSIPSRPPTTRLPAPSVSSSTSAIASRRNWPSRANGTCARPPICGNCACKVPP